MAFQSPALHEKERELATAEANFLRNFTVDSIMHHYLEVACFTVRTDNEGPSWTLKMAKAVEIC